jgi:hypothetical protein
MAEVVLVRWPEDRDASHLAREGVAVLYLLAGDCEPPAVSSCLEDWIRVPGDERDLRARVAALEARTAVHAASPYVDADGRLRYRGKVTVLRPDTIELARILTERFGDVVMDGELPAQSGSDLRSKVSDLRRQMRHVALTLRRVRRQGYRLEAV